MSRAVYYLGWDVGGWNCDHNAKSRDAIVILGSDLKIVGQPWRGNLRDAINKADSTVGWLHSVSKLCKSEAPANQFKATMAIDTPLGISEEFAKLIAGRKWTEQLGGYQSNTYLYRQTERFLFSRGFSPLSAIKDMIGSQATKGMHALAKFAPVVESCGVWTDGSGFRAIEAYPSASRDALIIKKLLKGALSLGNDDLDDARICALLAYLFEQDRSALETPSEEIPISEGWIWFPKQEARHAERKVR